MDSKGLDLLEGRLGLNAEINPYARKQIAKGGNLRYFTVHAFPGFAERILNGLSDRNMIRSEGEPPNDNKNRPIRGPYLSVIDISTDAEGGQTILFEDVNFKNP